MQNHIATLENNLAVFKKLNMDLPNDPVIVLLGVYPREIKHVHTKIGRQTVPNSSIMKSQQTEKNTYKYPAGEWLKKLCYIHIMKYYSAIF